jgi:hypothetical protein
MAFDKLNAADNVAVRNNVPESKISERFKLPPEFCRRRFERRFVG